MHIESHKNKIQPGQYLLDLIYNKVFSPYLSSYFGVKYSIIFFNDYNKTSEIILFSNKNRVLSTFNLFWKYNKYEKAYIWQLCTNDKREYNSYTFKNYRNKYDIRWKATILRNSQINEVVKYLG